MDVVLMTVPVPVAVVLYAIVPLGNLCVAIIKLGGLYLPLSWRILLFSPVVHAAAVGGIIGTTEKQEGIGDTGYREAARVHLIPELEG